MITEELILIKNNLDSALSRIDELIRIYNIENPTAGMSQQQKMDYILDGICNYGGILRRGLRKEGTRAYRVLFFRRIACYILSKYADFTEHEIADELDLTHGSVNNHKKKMAIWMDEPRFAPKNLHITTKNILIKLGYEKE